jgi:hypothetical protein
LESLLHKKIDLPVMEDPGQAFQIGWRPQQWCNFPGTPTPATPGWAAHLRRLA